MCSLKDIMDSVLYYLTCKEFMGMYYLQTSEGNRVDKIIRQRFRVGSKSVGISAAVEVYLVSQWDNF